MIQINYIPDFKNDNPYVVVTGERKAFLQAAVFFRNKSYAYVHDSSIASHTSLGSLTPDSLYLNAEECNEIANHCEQVVASGEPRHAYMQTHALSDVEIIISYGEYDF